MKDLGLRRGWGGCRTGVGLGESGDLRGVL